MSGNWDHYLARVDGHKASFFVDLGVRDEAPIVDASDVVWLRLFLRRPREDGSWDDLEHPTLQRIGDALAAVAREGASPAHYVGRCTSNGKRDYYFYCADPVWMESRLSMAMAGFSEYEFETGSFADPGWTTYLEFLYPDERSRQMMFNEGVLEQLAKHHDLHHVVREVTHYVYFSESSSREAFIVAANTLGFRVHATRDDAGDRRAFGVTLAHDSCVERETIDRIVLVLFDLAKEHDGEYDGWETSVVTL